MIEKLIQDNVVVLRTIRLPRNQTCSSAWWSWLVCKCWICLRRKLV